MEATRRFEESPCVPWDGNPRLYQSRAAEALIYVGQQVSHLAWITATCETEDCLEPTHLTYRAPLRISYPHGVCIYCGRHAATRDHLLPKPWTGHTARAFIATVPACGTCNSVLSDALTWSITERRAICHQRLRKHFAKTLRVADHTPEQLAQLDLRLRQYVTDGIEKKAEVLRMLAWPDDPNYDARALSHSGIEDPYALGLILLPGSDLDAIVGAVA